VSVNPAFQTIFQTTQMEKTGSNPTALEKISIFKNFKDDVWLLNLQKTDHPAFCRTIDQFIFVFGYYPHRPHGPEDVHLYQERWSKHARQTLKQGDIKQYRDLINRLLEARDYFWTAIENDLVWTKMVKEMKTRAVEQLSEKLFDWDAIENNRTMFCRCGHSLTRHDFIKTFGLE
jgi:hypothetical protein